MKRKYLLRGMGIGVFTAGLIAFLVTLSGVKMSDEKILERARELGYEDRNVVIQEIRSEEGPVKLTDQTPANSTKETSEKSIAEEILPDGVTTSEEASDKDAKKAEEESAKKAEEEKKAKEEAEAKKKAEEEAKKAEEEKKAKEEEEAKKKAEEEARKAEEEKKAKEEAEAKKKAEEEAKKAEEDAKKTETTGDTVTITVKSGQFSETVAKACQTAGLVTSAAEFDNYLCKNGYANRISVGDHKIAKGASFEEIAKALCK